MTDITEEKLLEMGYERKTYEELVKSLNLEAENCAYMRKPLYGNLFYNKNKYFLVGLENKHFLGIGCPFCELEESCYYNQFNSGRILFTLENLLQLEICIKEMQKIKFTDDSGFLIHELLNERK